ncbi:Regulator of V-ATPase in vacuolar membrane protein 1 [Termitomyces sp. T112]|nr:Regulator of V-ATPase in vacuolar membrane protein 1 [Termitomyces sp. T112]
MNNRIAAWSLSGAKKGTWLIHSTLILPESQIITALDCKSGLLAVGSQPNLSVYTLILENDLPSWSQKWTIHACFPTCVRFAPSLMYIATSSASDNAIRMYSTTSGRQTQVISHPRTITNFAWRQPQAASRDDLILYTVTDDATIRIFLPVLDSPQQLQLHASLDIFSSLPFSAASHHLNQTASTAFWLDREVVENALNETLKKWPDQDNARLRRIKDIKDERWDLFLRVLGDGSVVVSAVANVDRRPPTLLKQFTLQQLPPSTLPGPPSHLFLLPNTDPSMLRLAVSSPLTIFNLSPVAFFDAQNDGLRLSSYLLPRILEEESKIVRLVRTPEGAGVGIVRIMGGEAWRVLNNGTQLVRSGSWCSADHVVVLQRGRIFVTYLVSDGTLTLHSTPPQRLFVPAIDYLFSIPSEDEGDSIVGITTELSIVHLCASYSPSPTLLIRSQSHLPLSHPPKFILPVDPMAWGQRQSWTEQDVLLSVSHTGELDFWVPEDFQTPSWRRTGTVKTGRTRITKASCSSAKKTALRECLINVVKPYAYLCSILVVPGPCGDELTIWNSQESEFATGLDFSTRYSERINDLDWTSTPDNQSILAVGFRHHVELLCQQRMTYFDEGPGWAMCTTIEIGGFIPLPISDSIWLDNGSLLIAAGHQMFLYDSSSLASDEETLFEYAARHNGPLDDYHPQMILQCLLWGKVELVKDIIVNLSKDVAASTRDHSRIQRTSLPVESFFKTDSAIISVSVQRKGYTSLFENPSEPRQQESEEGFSRSLVLDLLEALETHPLPHLTPNEQSHLLTLIQTTLEIDEQRRALDSNGLRYLISMRSFYILNHRSSVPSSPQSEGAQLRASGRRERLRYRDMIWAFHSESQDLLLNASSLACDGKLGWIDARAVGIPIWLTSVDTLRTQMEVIARNEYMAGDNRDPTACSLYYFALGKVKLVHGLWRQAAWHKEQGLMLKFLSNDFSEPRWRTAALKNAFALLSKRRFEYAAAFFLLGGALKDAVNVCIKQLDDFQLAVALARAVEQSNEGPILLEILDSVVLPIAFKNGNRWLASWAFWLLHRRDMAVRILLTPLQDIANSLNIQVTEIGEPHYDDPSLALLFSQLRSKTLQAAKGTSEISGRSEYNFVLQMARVFCRMGCHVLGLDLVRSWSFDRPSAIDMVNIVVANDQVSPPPSPNLSRRSLFDRAVRRRSSIMIDIPILSQPPTRTASPERPTIGVPPVIKEHQELLQNQGDLYARKVGLGNLIRSAKQDIEVPEFDMNSFF